MGEGATHRSLLDTESHPWFAEIMAYTLPVSFDRFIEAISLTGKHEDTAEARRKRLVALLEASFTILDTIPTGSIIRETALVGHADLDIMVVLHYGKHIKDKTPRRVLEDVREALEGYSRIVKKNGQAVTLYYSSWPNVDIVPACRITNDDGSVNYYEIPDMTRNRWLRSRPRSHNSAMAAASERQRELVRMVKTWNREHSGLMQSYHLEVLTLSLPDVTQGWPFEIHYFFDHAVQLIDLPLYHPNGTPGRVDDYLDQETRQAVKQRLERARDRASAAKRTNDVEEAIRLYRVIFGGKFPAYG
jgi:hypothetical protein